MVKIVCENNSDKNKIQELLDFLGIKHNDDNFIPMGNKSNIFKEKSDEYKTLLALIKGEKVKKVLLIADSDYEKDDYKYGGYENTENELNELIKKLNIKNISTIYIACDPISKNGYLESLLLSTVDDNLKKCYNDFLVCIDFPNKTNHKYIMEQLHKLTQPNKPYDFGDKNFHDLKEKLTKLFE